MNDYKQSRHPGILTPDTAFLSFKMCFIHFPDNLFFFFIKCSEVILKALVL